jgi:tight adherence protein C
MYLFGFAALAALLLPLLIVYKTAGRRYAGWVAEHGRRFKLRTLHPSMLYWMDKFRIESRVPALTARLQQSMSALHGFAHSSVCAKLALAELLSFIWAGLALSLLLFLFSDGDGAVLYASLLPTAAVPLGLLKDWEKQAERRRQNMVLALPAILDKVMLLVNAGETVQQALVRCALKGTAQASQPLYAELSALAREMANGMSFSLALERFGHRCAVHEVSVFATAVLLNHRRGGQQLAETLQELSDSMWEKRKAIAKTRGEEASAKLVFPMVIIFLVVLALVASPAFLMINL